MKLKSAFLPAAIFALLTSIAAAESRPREVHADVPVIETVPGKGFLHAGPMVGHVSHTTARLWAKVSNAAKLSFRVGESADLAHGRVVKAGTLEEDESFTGQVEVTGLKPATRYYYVPLIDGEPAMLPPYPSFVTAPPPGESGKLRIAFGSCVGPRGYTAAAAFGEMAARGNFDMLLMLGDNHYANTTDRDLLRDYLFMLRTVGGFEQIIRRTPTYAIWDDHDYGPNNSDGTLEGKADSLAVHKQWWANPSYGEEGNPGCYFKFSRGDIDFFMLDVRYYRTPNKITDEGAKTMLGERQLAWLKKGLAESRAKFKVIASGSEWQTMTQPDCWSSFARERQEIFDQITGNHIEGVVLLSGDRHFSAGYQIQGRFLEFTSGPIGSGNATLRENPERFTGCDEGKMWMVLELDTAAAQPRLAYEIWQAGGGMLERRELTYDQVNGRATIPPSPPLLPERMEAKPAR